MHLIHRPSFLPSPTSVLFCLHPSSPRPKKVKVGHARPVAWASDRPTDRLGFVAAAAGHENSDPQSAFLHAAADAAKCTFNRAASSSVRPRPHRPTARPSFRCLCVARWEIAAGHVSLSFSRSLGCLSSRFQSAKYSRGLGRA